MVRRALLVGSFAVVFLLASAAFASTFTGEVAFQHADAVSGTAQSVRYVNASSGPALLVGVRVTNPTGLPVHVERAELVGYVNGSAVTYRRSVRANGTVSAGGGTVVRVRLPVQPGDASTARQAARAGRVRVSGVLYATLRGKRFDAGVSA